MTFLTAGSRTPATTRRRSPSHRTPSHRSAPRLTAAAAAAALAISGLGAVVGTTAATAAPTTVFHDSFTRTVASGWGTADSGGAWTTRGGTASGFSVNGTAGMIAMKAGELPNFDAGTVSAHDTDITATVAADRTAKTNSGVYVALVSRRQSTNEQYAVVLGLASTPPVLQVYRRDAAKKQINIGALATLTGATYTPGDTWRIRFATTGANPTTLTAKAWKASTPEPATWAVTVTDSTSILQGSGTSGLSTCLSSKATDGPVTVSIDDFAVTTVVVPASPVGLTAAPGDGQVDLAWSAVAGADSYRVYRDGALVATPTTSSWVDGNLTNGTTYRYSVTANNTAGESPTSATADAAPLPPVPAVPTGLTASAGDTQVSLHWTAVPRASEYVVQRDGVVLTTTTATALTDTSVVNGTTYAYTVTATNLGGVSAPSAAVSARPLPPVPAVPTGLSATASDTRVALTWDAVPGASAYDITRDGVLLASPSTTSLTDSGLTNGTTYAYTVAATNLAGSSAATAAVTARPLPPAPSAPTGLIASAGDAQVVVGWPRVNGATGYVVYRNGTVAASTTATSLTDIGLANGTTYTYTVTATNLGGVSAPSAPVTARPLPPLPSTPTGVAVSASSAQAVLTWPTVAGATAYDVYRNGVLVGRVAVTTLTDSGLVNGTTYTYTVAASNLAGTSGLSAPVTATPSGLPAAPAGWTTTFVDDFNGTAVDTTKWNVRNNAANSNEQSYLLARNVTVSKGLLNVTAQRESVGGKTYSSGYLDSIGKYSQRYGIWQVRAKVNTPIGKSQGMWPAPLWLRGDTSPMEIDLIEAWGTGPTVLNGYRTGSGSSSIHQSTNGGGGKVSGWLTPAGVDLSADFHLYEVEWNPAYISVRVDGVEKVRATPSNAPWAFTGTDYAGAANMRVNLQVSKADAYYGGPIASTISPSTMQIDYIRVLKKP